MLDSHDWKMLDYDSMVLGKCFDGFEDKISDYAMMKIGFWPMVTDYTPLVIDYYMQFLKLRMMWWQITMLR